MSQGQMSFVRFPENQVIHVEARADKDGCTIAYQTGETYLYEKKKVPDPVLYYAAQNRKQNDSGAWFSEVTSLKSDLDKAASVILNKNVEGKDYYGLSESAYVKAKKEAKAELAARAAENGRIPYDKWKAELKKLTEERLGKEAK